MINTIIRRIYNLYELYKKVFLVTIGIYFLLLLAYDLVFLKRDISSILLSYVLTLIVCVFSWFGVRFVLWVQIKNKLCTQNIFNIFSIVVMLAFILSSVVFGIEYFANGFISAAFVAPIAFLSAVDVQKYRKEWLK